MTSRFLPLSETPRPALEQYLLRAGLAADVVVWKYFDTRFAPGRERGIAWLRGDKVEGLLGLVPSRFREGARLLDVGWTSDWAVEDAERRPGIGIKLLTRAQQHVDAVLTLGGNEQTRSLLPRIARDTIEEAAVDWYLPLRLGGTSLAARLRRRWAGAWWRPMEQWPLPSAIWMSRPHDTSTRVAVVQGISAQLEQVLGPVGDEATNGPVYDVDYVDWQLGRCPVVDSWTLMTESARPSAAAVLWRRRQSKRVWRLAAWRRDGADDEVRALVRCAIDEVRGGGGAGLAVLAPSVDPGLAGVLQELGFRRVNEPRPLFVTTNEPAAGGGVHGVRRLSYVDSDLAYRVPREM